ncbi:MAG: VCBS repeat-containing protein, partial [Herbaspirillum sp.]|uniref:FG-GAP repeat domain-containing protein n=1 Tax=Herbaspirillum sp. TaxID=1890675 RepID=UPI0025825669
THVAVGDLDGDARPEIVAMLRWSKIVVLEHTGEVKWTLSGPSGGSYGGPSIANVDGEGLPEIIVGAWVLNADGTFHSSQRRNAGRGLVSVADLDLDGTLEIVGGNQAWRHDGTVFFSTGGYDGFPAIGNFDTDLFPEIVVAKGGRIYLYEHDGTEKWSLEHPGSGFGGPPTVADFDGDGAVEVGVAGSHQYAVVDTDGRLLWTSPTVDTSSHITSSAVFDFEGDGSAEVVYNDHFYLRVYRGRDGAVLAEIKNPSCTLTENPVIADVDADGNAEI